MEDMQMIFTLYKATVWLTAPDLSFAVPYTLRIRVHIKAVINLAGHFHRITIVCHRCSHYLKNK